MNIHDAPYIQEAELDGMPGPETVYCPVCNAEDPMWIYVSRTVAGGMRDVIGCSECVDRVSADEAAELMRRYEE